MILVVSALPKELSAGYVEVIEADVISRANSLLSSAMCSLQMSCLQNSFISLMG